MTCQNNQQEYDPDAIHRPWIGRLFGAIWVVNLVPLVLLLIDRSQSGFTIRTVLGWLALVGIAGAFLWLVLLGIPHWVPRSSRDVAINRVLVAGQMVIITGIILAWPNEGFEYYLIYPAVLSGMYFPRREASRWLGFIASLFISLTVQHRQWGDLAQGTLLIVGLGINTVFWTALLEQNRQLRRARAEISRLAATDERLRIARDLHDLLGHSLSLIALKSELALRLLPDYVDRATGEVRDIEAVARTSLQEVREAVSGYRAKTLADELDGAAQMLDAAGIDLRQTMQLGTLPMDIERTLAWFVREGVTNVIRHAQASRVTIALLEHRGTVTAEIEDDGAGSDPEASPGSGLQGLRERIASLGGSLTVGPVPGGGYRLHAVIPPEAPAVPEPDDSPLIPDMAGERIGAAS